MREGLRSPVRRAALALAATLALFIVVLRFFPEAVPIFPAAVAPVIWLALFPGDRPVDPRTRRVLWILVAAGMLTFALGVGAFVVAS